MSLVLAITALHGADPCDPYASGDSRHAIACLDALDGPLDRTPDDQHLLGLAIMAHVNLVLPTPQHDPGDAGPFLDHARTLRDRRVAARKGAPHVSLDEALPELWLAACEGHMRQVVDHLDRVPAAVSHPLARALRCFATRDPRPLDGAKTLHHLGSYARVWSMVEDDGSVKREEEERSHVDLPQRQWRLLRRTLGGRPSPDLRRLLVAETAWMLGSDALGEAEAVGLLGRLLQGGGAPVPDGSGRAALIGMAQSLTRMGAALAAWRICDQLASRTAGMMDGPRHQLAALGDLARWNRDWLTRTLAVDGWHEPPEPAMVQTVDTLADDPASRLLAHWMRLKAPRNFWDERFAYRFPACISIGEAQAAFTAITANGECSHPAPDPLRMAMATAITACGTGTDPTPVLDLLARRRATGGREAGPIERRRACTALIHAGHGPDATFRAQLARWCADDPWDQELETFRRLWAPDHRRLTTAIPPEHTWIMPAVSGPIIPPAGPATTANGILQVRWTGAIRLPAPGIYRFAVEAADGARLVVGDAVVDNWFCNRHYRCPVTWTCNAGWTPLTLEFFHDDPGSFHCRLYWQPPGSDTWSLIPAAVLAHGDDHQPGLHTALWSGDLQEIGVIPDESDCAWVRQRPWLQATTRIGPTLAATGHWKESIPWLETAQRRGGNHMTTRCLFAALIMQDSPDIARALALPLEPCSLYFTGSRDATMMLSERLCRIGASQAMRKILDPYIKPHLPGWDAISSLALARARCALHDGLFAQAHADLSWLLAVPARQEPLARAAFHRQCLLEHLLLARITGTAEPAPDALLESLEKLGIEQCPWDQAVLSFLMGWSDWPTAQARAATSARPAWIRYYHGLQAIAEHRHDEARADFQALISAGPDWPVTTMARGLLRWLERLTPEEAARLPTARAIVIRADPRIPAGAGNF